MAARSVPLFSEPPAKRGYRKLHVELAANVTLRAVAFSPVGRSRLAVFNIGDTDHPIPESTVEVKLVL
jgi:hypothetical protein